MDLFYFQVLICIINWTLCEWCNAAFLGIWRDSKIKLPTFGDSLYQEHICVALKYSLRGELTSFWNRAIVWACFCIFIKCVNFSFEKQVNYAQSSNPWPLPNL